MKLELGEVKKEAKASIPALSLPPWVNSLTWQEFMAVRKRLKAVDSARASSDLLKDLERLSGCDPEKTEKILSQSIVNSWKGVFPLKDSAARPQFSNTFAASMNGKNSDGSAVDYGRSIK